ncbi:MAG: N-acetyl-gamma-glutamyl-phosphate reductase [Candidatus Omnitrophica bacterium]|nr:N-acetyl-gamma-glutamyl-phosphate reductase [Candidatus Omnitrophota bacterium]
MPTVRVAIAGATGYAGEELLRLLLEHPHVQLACLAASAKRDRPVPLSEVFPRFSRRLDLSVESLDPQRLASAEVVFLALPHGQAAALAPQLVSQGKRVIDLSGDFRLRDPSLYPRWYRFDHPQASWLTDSRVVYGLPEFHRDALGQARLVANPGCYATSILLGCLPLFEAGLAGTGELIVDAKSGLTGAGRKAEVELLFTEMTENLRPYKVNQHQHAPEVLQEIQAISGRPARMLMVPQAIPVARGLISMIYAKTSASLEAVVEAYQARYAPARTPFVRVRAGELPQLRNVVGTNVCEVGLVLDPEQRCLVIASALDNLTKGAAGQAVQNFNLMHGFPETLGLN